MTRSFSKASKKATKKIKEERKLIVLLFVEVIKENKWKLADFPAILLLIRLICRLLTCWTFLS
jgi:hypothetical protein